MARDGGWCGGARVTCGALLTAIAWATAMADSLPLEAPGPLDSRIRLETSDRVRGEFWSYFETAPSSPTPNSDYDFLGNRMQLGVRVTRAPFEFFAQLQDSIVYPAPADAPGAGGQYFVNTHREFQHEPIFRQGWFRYRNAFTVSGLGMVLGRQLYRDGLESPAEDPTLLWLQRFRIAERLIGPFDYTHVGRSFDGGQVAWENASVNATAFGFVPTAGGFEINANREIPNIAVAGLSVNAKESRLLPRTNARLFYDYYDDHRPIVFLDNRPEAARKAAPGGLALHTVGANATHVSPIGPGRLDLLAWAAGQVGEWQNLEQRAWCYAIEAGYQLPALPGAPWLRAGIDSGSGDGDPADGTHGTFFQLLPTARTYALFPFYNLMNNRDVFAELMVRPHDMLAVRSDLHWLRVNASEDFVYAGGGATSQHVFGYGGTPTNGRSELAYVVDLGLTLTPVDHLTIGTYYAHAFGQGIVHATFVGDAADYGYIEVTVSY